MHRSPVTVDALADLEERLLTIIMGHLRALPAFVVAGAVLYCTVPGAPRLMAQKPHVVFAGRPELDAASVPEVRIVEGIDETHLTTLKGNTHPYAKARFDRGRVSPDLPMGDLVLVLRRGVEQQAAFDAFVASQYDVKSPNYHRWLEPKEVGESFGPSQSDIDTVSNWLRDHGFAIDEVANDRLSIRFSGTAAQVESTFHTEIHHLEVMTKDRAVERHIGNMADPQIPLALAPVVVGVKALHNFFPRPLHRLGGTVTRDSASGTWRRSPAASSIPGQPDLTPTMRAQPQFGTANAYGDALEDVAPYDFATIYNVLPLWAASTPIDGTGQTIAIAGTSNINLADVAAFRSAFGLPAKAPTVVITNNDPGNCPTFASSCSGDLIENTLDVEWSGAVAKGANIVLVTSSAPTPTSDPLYLSESYIVQHKTASIMNVSYGACELVLGTAGNTQYYNLWQTAASEGIAVFVASGDSGSPSCDQGFDAYYGVPYLAVFGLSVSGIGSTPYNTSVGGTDFNWGSTAAPYWNASNSGTTKANAVGYIPEVPWNSTCVNPLILPALQSDAAYLGVSGVVDAESACNFIGAYASQIYQNYGVSLSGLIDTIGGGGGASNCTVSFGTNPAGCMSGYAKPSWQANVPGIPKDGERDIPDVSFFASNGFLGSSYLICVSGIGNGCAYSATAEPSAQEVGGTSVASPAMAGVMALVNQKVGSTQGNPNTTLYTLAAEQNYSNCSAEKVKTSSAGCIFNDIDTGTNAMACLNPAIQQSFNCTVLNAQDSAGILFGYSAGAGYDPATGLGSLNVANLANNWPTGASVAVVVLSPSSLSFASTTVNTASATQAVTLKNTGKVALTLSGTGLGIGITGANASSFSQTNNCGTSLAAGGSCTINVTFKPTVAGALTASVSIGDNAYGSPQTVALSGTGAAAAPTVQISANSLAFGSTAVGSTNTAPAITLTNTGTGLLTLTSIGFTGTNATSFTQTNTCGTTVAAGANCSITISFRPTVAGSLTAALSVVDNATGSPQTVALSGTATGGTGGLTVTLTPASLSFASTAVGATSAAQTVTLMNTSASAVTLSSYSITGTNAASFLISAKTCPGSLPANSSCSIPIEFKPVAAGSLTASLSVADNAAGSPQMVTLSGTGTSGSGTPTVSLMPSTLIFPTTAPGSTSAAQVLTFKNTGTVAATVNSFTFTGTNASSFLISTKTCTTSLAVGASCTLSIAFKPATVGTLTATFNAADNATGSPQTVALSGSTGAAQPTVTLSPATLTFPATAVGVTSTAQVLTLKNTGTSTVSVSSFAIAGTNASSFLISTKTCTTSLAVGASCTLSIAFKPAASGTLTATFNATDNATGSPQTVALKGTGATASPTVTLTPTNLTFAATTVGSTSAAQVLTFTNSGSTALSVSSFKFTGANASSFLLSAKTCTTSLAAGASCTLSVACKPTATGALSASLLATDNAANSPQTVALSGTGK